LFVIISLIVAQQDTPIKDSDVYHKTDYSIHMLKMKHIRLIIYQFRFNAYQHQQEHAVEQMVEALCYKPEGRGSDSR
jgi:hypothetical protein